MRKIKELASKRLYSEPFYDNKHVKNNVKTFNSVIITYLLAKRFQKITIDSIMRMDKKNYCQVYLEECKYAVKEKKMAIFIEAELEFDGSDFHFDSE